MSRIYKRKGSPFYWYETYIRGRRVRKSTQVSKKTLATRIQDEWDILKATGDYSFIGKSSESVLSKGLISNYITKYLAFVESRKSENTHAIAKGVFDKLQEYLAEEGIKMIEDVNVGHIDGYIDWLTVASKTKKNHLGVISIMFKQAVREGVVSQNPCEFATLPKITHKERHRMLTHDDIEVIFKNSGKWRLYYAFLLYTGLRAGDVAMLRYESLDVNDKSITQLIRKSRKVYQLPMADILIDEIGNIEGKEGPIFPTLYNENESKLNDRLANPRKFMQKILSVAERPKATLHSFRHVFNNLLLAQGLSIQDRQTLLAHSSSDTTKIYTHPNAEVAANYINQLPNYLESTEK